MNIGFITGTIRSGTTMLSRCIADHPNAISYRELQLTRVVFCRELQRHVRNVLSNGFTSEQQEYLTSKLQLYSPDSIEKWLLESLPMGMAVFDRKDPHAIVEKDPEFSLEPRAIEWALNKGHKLIHTLRHPCALRNNPNEAWGNKAVTEAVIGFQNIMRFKDHPCLLILKYEDITSQPEFFINKIYSHLGLKEDNTFLNRPSHHLDSARWWFYPNITSKIDKNKNNEWKTTLSPDTIQSVLDRIDVQEYLRIANYDRN